jgi:hypothetical protein
MKSELNKLQDNGVKVGVYYTNMQSNGRQRYYRVERLLLYTTRKQSKCRASYVQVMLYLKCEVATGVNTVVGKKDADEKKYSKCRATQPRSCCSIGNNVEAVVA